MYKIKLFTSQWEFFLKTDVTSLPDDKFIKATNSFWVEYYVNRDEIRFYKVYKCEWEEEK